MQRECDETVIRMHPDDIRGLSYDHWIYTSSKTPSSVSIDTSGGGGLVTLPALGAAELAEATRCLRSVARGSQTSPWGPPGRRT
jgi:hypothetical protein